jgi:CHRD domain
MIAWQFFAELDPSQNVHTSCDTTKARGSFIATYEKERLCFRMSYSGLSATEVSANIRGPALLGAGGAIQFVLPGGPVKRSCIPVKGSQAKYLNDGLLYVNVTTSTAGCAIGEIRGQILPMG